MIVGLYLEKNCFIILQEMIYVMLYFSIILANKLHKYKWMFEQETIIFHNVRSSFGSIMKSLK